MTLFSRAQEFKSVSEVRKMPCMANRKVEKKLRPLRQPTLAGFLYSLLEAFLCTLLKHEQRALSEATKQVTHVLFVQELK